MRSSPHAQKRHHSSATRARDSLEQLQSELQQKDSIPEAVLRLYSAVKTDPLARGGLTCSDYERLLLVATEVNAVTGGNTQTKDAFAVLREHMMERKEWRDDVYTPGERAASQRLNVVMGILDDMVSAGFELSSEFLGTLDSHLRRQQKFDVIVGICNHLWKKGKANGATCLWAVLASCATMSAQEVQEWWERYITIVQSSGRHTSPASQTFPASFLDRLITARDADGIVHVLEYLLEIDKPPDLDLYARLIDLCAEFPHPDDASRLFQIILKSLSALSSSPPSLIERLHHAMLHCYIQANDLERASQLCERMREAVIRIYPETYTGIMELALGKDDAEFVVRLYEGRPREEGKFNARGMNAVIQAYLLLGNVESAEEILEAMSTPSLTSDRKPHPNPNPHTFHTLISHHLKHLDPDAAHRIYQRMKTYMTTMTGFHPLSKTYMALLNAFAHHGDPIIVRTIFDEMVSTGVKPDVMHFTILVWMYAHRVDDPSAVQGTLEEMRRWGVEPDAGLCNVLLHKVVKDGGAGGGVEEARRVVEGGVLPGGVEPDVISFTIVLKGVVDEVLRGRGEGEGVGDAVRFFRKMEERVGVDREGRTNVDGIAYGVLIDFVGRRKGDVEGAEAVWREMRGKGVVPGVGVWNTRLAVHARWGTPGSTVRVFSDMVGEGVKPDVECFTTLISSFVRNEGGDGGRKGGCEGGGGEMKVFREMIRSGVAPDAIAVAALMQGFAKRRDVESAKRVLGEIRGAFGVVLDEDVYAALLSGCRGDRETAKGILEEMVRDGLVPSRRMAEMAKGWMLEVKKDGKGEWVVCG
ncbi:hypothetical protein HDV00_001077 [Rhizophlyctis rosea]|nr:hypothetical protein HDV00_001077 [Rhizophlyctis rosea]